MATFNRLLVADLSGEFDADLIRYGAKIAAITDASHSLVLPPAAAIRVNAHSPSVRAICEEQGADEPVYRMLLEPDLQGLYAIAWHSAADLILLRYSSESRESRRLARRIIRTAPCSVWLLPSGHAGNLERVLAGFKLSETGAAVVETSAALARGVGGEMIASHVWLDPTHLDPTDRVHQSLRLEKIRTVRRFLWGLDSKGVSCEVKIEHSVLPALSLLRVAKETAADLLVIPAPDVSGIGLALHRDETDPYLQAQLPLLSVRLENPQQASFQDFWRDLFYLPEPAFG